jgi:hypothetical protein
MGNDRKPFPISVTEREHSVLLFRMGLILPARGKSIAEDGRRLFETHPRDLVGSADP